MDSNIETIQTSQEDVRKDENSENIDTTNVEELLDFTNLFKTAKVAKPKLIDRRT